MKLVRSENDLPTIRIGLDRTGGTCGDVVFEVLRGRGHGHEIARCSSLELGLPETPSADLSAAERCVLPSRVLSALTVAVDQLGEASLPPRNAIWLELSGARGYLYLVPWEQLLTPLGRPVLRIPYHVLRPQASATTLSIALCVSSPSAKAEFDTINATAQMFAAWVVNAGRDVKLHVFADTDCYQELVVAAPLLSDAVVCHDPRQAEDYRAPRRPEWRTGSTEITSPWLRWIRDALDGRAVDVLQFVAHGYLSGDRGAVALSRNPTYDSEVAAFVGAVELTSFLAQIGAWALVLSGPRSNYSPVGLRGLADSVAQARPGATLVHELGLDPLGLSFAQAVQLVFGHGLESAPPLPGLTCWVHPAGVQYPEFDQDALHLTGAGHSALIGNATEDAIAAADTPAWVAAGARYLEAQQSDWLPEQPDATVDPSAAIALQSVSSLLERHVAQHLGPDQEWS